MLPDRQGGDCGLQDAGANLRVGTIIRSFRSHFLVSLGSTIGFDPSEYNSVKDVWTEATCSRVIGEQ